MVCIQAESLALALPLCIAGITKDIRVTRIPIQIINSSNVKPFDDFLNIYIEIPSIL